MGTTSGNKTLVTETSAADIKTSVQVMDDWDEADRCKVNTIAGQAGIAGGAGAVDGTVPRTTQASDSPAVVALQLIDDAVATEGGAANTKGIMMAVDDGANNRNAKGGADGAFYVNQNALLPGEDAVADERSVKIKTLGTNNGSSLAAAINTVGGGTIGDAILTSTEVLGYSRICIEFKNAAGGGGNDIDRLIVFGSVSGSNWDPIYDSGTGLAWAAADGALTVLIESNCYRYIKTEGLTAAGSTTVDCYWCGNKG